MGGQVVVKVATNVKCSAKIPSSCTWIKESKSTQSRALRDESIVFDVEKNNTVEERSEEIVITDNKSLTKTIKVKQAAQMIMLESNSLELMVDDVKTLNCKKNSSVIGDFQWSSSNTSVATVSSTGEIRASGRGSATITVKTQDGKYSVSCKLTVKDILDCITSYTSFDYMYIVSPTLDITWKISLYNSSPYNVKLTNFYIQPYNTNFLYHMVGNPQISYSSTTVQPNGKATISVRIIEQGQSVSLVDPSATFAVCVEFEYKGKKYEKKIPIYIDYSY